MIPCRSCALFNELSYHELVHKPNVNRNALLILLLIGAKLLLIIDLASAPVLPVGLCWKRARVALTILSVDFSVVLLCTDIGLCRESFLCYFTPTVIPNDMISNAALAKVSRSLRRWLSTFSQACSMRDRLVCSKQTHSSTNGSGVPILRLLRNRSLCTHRFLLRESHPPSLSLEGKVYATLGGFLKKHQFSSIAHISPCLWCLSWIMESRQTWSDFLNTIYRQWFVRER